MQRRRELMTFEHGHWATATGSIATFNTPFAKPLRSLKAEFTPVQEGTGDPSPTNVRPISGWTGLTAYRTGQNIWDEQWERGSYYTSTGEPKDIYDSNIRSKATSPIPIEPNTSYYVCIGVAINVRCLFYTENDEFLSAPTSVRNGIITSPSNARLMRFYVGTGYGGTYGNNIAINYPAIATTYASYSSTTIPVDWTTEVGTIYGGYVDLVKGEVWVEYIERIYDGSSDENWALSGNNTFVCAQGDVKKDVRNIRPLCDKFLMEQTYRATYPIRPIGNSQFASTVAEWRSWLAANPIQVVYELAEPITYQLTPVQLRTLIGTNNIWSTANGNVTAEYWTR